MLRPPDWAPRCCVLALLLMLLPPRGFGAQPSSLGQKSTQEEGAPQQAPPTQSDVIVVPDGTPIILQLVSGLSSATAKVGDTVEFITPYPLRINGLIVVPKGTAISGTVVQVSHPHRPAKNGRVSVAIEKLVLPNGEVGTLRHSKSATKKPARIGAQSEPGDLGKLWLFAPLDFPVGWIVLAVAPFTKGHEAVYPAGTRTLVYLDGPLNLDRIAVLNSQPPPYKGPPQVFFNETSARVDNWLNHEFSVVFCGEVVVGPHSVPLRLALNPGTYSFTVRLDFRNSDLYLKSDKKFKEWIAKEKEWNAKEELKSKLKAVPVQLEVLQDHQYWVDRDRRGLFVRDIQQHQTEFDIVQNDLPWVDKDMTSLPPQDSCPQVDRPAAQPNATPSTRPPTADRKPTR